MESSPNLTSSSFSEDQEAEKEPRRKISLGIIDFYTFQQVTFSEKNVKKEAKTHKWYKTS